VSKTTLLLYLSSAADPGRFAIAPALAAAAERAGWRFDCYYDAFRAGRHFGGGRLEEATPGRPAGSLVAGGRHADQLIRLAAAYQLVALGDPDSVCWPALDAAGAESVIRSVDPADLYEAGLERLGQPLPRRALLLDATPQGKQLVIVAPYLYPAFFSGEPVLGVEVGVHSHALRRLEQLGVGEFDDATGDVADADYAEVTSRLARRHSEWGRGILLGDPALVAAQLPLASRLRLVPLYGRPQVDVVSRSAEQIRAARTPVYGRQYDDRDFFELARLGHGLQLVDPEPPFDAAQGLGLGVPSPRENSAGLEPDDAQLQAWADEGRVLVTLLLWAGMIRELDCIPRLIDLVAETELKAGLVVTAETLEHGAGFSLELLGVPPDRGGVLGRLELLLASAGRAVGAETLLPQGTLEQALGEARAATASHLPPELVPRGWWPLLDTALVARRTTSVGWRSRRPVLRFTPRGEPSPEDAAASSQTGARDVRALAGLAVRGLGLESLFEEWRPFDRFRPGSFDAGVAAAVRGAGFSYMWSKAEFGQSRVLHRDGDFVALSLTAGNWDGWSPFYTVSSKADLLRAERRLNRSSNAGWVVGTIDSPLWALSGEVLERGAALYQIARHTAAGGRSEKLVNVTPNVVARYARVLDERGSLNAGQSSQRP
jgi:hypothetical protein